jgi:hypothetical protein
MVGVVATRRVYVERMLGTGPPLGGALLALTNVLRRIMNTGPFEYVGFPPQRIERSELAVTAWLEEVRARRRRGEAAVFRLSDGITSDNAIYYELDSAPGRTAEFVWWSLEETPPPLSVMISLVREAAKSFGGHRGCVEDTNLLLVYRGAQSYRRALSVVPAHLLEFLPVPPHFGENAGKNLEVLVPQEFDRRRVPDAVWWINFWSPELVATVGSEVILGAPWELCREAEGGGLLLAVVVEPLDLANPEHNNRLNEICRRLHLRELQEMHRYPKNAQAG